MPLHLPVPCPLTEVFLAFWQGSLATLWVPRLPMQTAVDDGLHHWSQDGQCQTGSVTGTWALSLVPGTMQHVAPTQKGRLPDVGWHLQEYSSRWHQLRGVLGSEKAEPTGPETVPGWTQELAQLGGALEGTSLAPAPGLLSPAGTHSPLSGPPDISSAPFIPPLGVSCHCIT